MEMLDSKLTILEIKRLIYNKIKPAFKDSHPIHSGTDEDLNYSLIFHVYDNIPKYRKDGYLKKGNCEFCKTSHG
jgi:hypothetical protein